MKQFAIIAALAAVASAHWVASNGTHYHDADLGKPIRKFSCGATADNAPKEFLDAIKTLHHGSKHSQGGTRSIHKTKKQVPSSISVPTYFHVISTTEHNGTITQDMVNAQIGVMNTVYNQYGVSFQLVNTSWTVNDDWAVAADEATMDALKSALRIGTYDNINMYYHTDLYGGDLGTCTLPSQVPAGADPSVYSSDGCNVNANTMPNGTMEGYNLGMTSVHETGHWLGLLHTFEGYSCSGDGDYVSDTKVESQSTSGCPISPPKDSCPSVPGNDPINNYMDYSTDACYNNFTPGQVARIASLWTQFRAGQ